MENVTVKFGMQGNSFCIEGILNKDKTITVDEWPYEFARIYDKEMNFLGMAKNGRMVDPIESESVARFYQV